MLPRSPSKNPGFGLCGVGVGLSLLSCFPHLDHQGRNCLEDDDQIQRQGLVSRIVNVESGHFNERRSVLAADLPIPGEPGQCLEAFLLPGEIMVELVRQTGARPDQTHLPAQYVDQLGQFIQARRSKEHAKWDNSGITS